MTEARTAGVSVERGLRRAYLVLNLAVLVYFTSPYPDDLPMATTVANWQEWKDSYHRLEHADEIKIRATALTEKELAARGLPSLPIQTGATKRWIPLDRYLEGVGEIDAQQMDIYVSCRSMALSEVRQLHPKRFWIHLPRFHWRGYGPQLLGLLTAPWLCHLLGRYILAGFFKTTELVN